MKKLVIMSAIAVSLLSATGATADLSIYDIGRNQSAAAVHRSAPLGEREACNDQWLGMDVLSCGTSAATSAQRPAWRGLN